MAIVTLTTDFGDKGFDLPKLKGALLAAAPSAQLIDLTHQVSNYDIVQAAFLLRNAWQSFPKGTLHLISVNDYPSGTPRFLAAAYRGHYFIAPDNGLFSLIFPEDAPKQYHLLEYAPEELMSLERIYARAIGHLAQGRPLIELGAATTEVMQRITLQPVIGPSQIRGSVIFVDSFDALFVRYRTANMLLCQGFRSEIYEFSHVGIISGQITNKIDTSNSACQCE